ncbi:bifunctional folylpolyglutamate synthase/dihydrofolate synthase [Fructobacillus sp. M1-13]|uniref:tetrahydrofolate synthase n=1 Tax=Fructobacillus papyriferae TaxID=2713171 RepID=A0ABS5QQJ8_9LACO|nr:folylpolyglutamate synthase/dihydrofolate synthase family protein [Fructobacillus papyriferae]MBS9335381.1 bifunctional folylpolyglutamate synthase/dihydrofolate synthase [Fructobacillus papyriferae]MCD2158949.1 bifunctional folylpolyglutamate synthase/dihydrofolate synthase [Fructobacillus papyriferae]
MNVTEALAYIHGRPKGGKKNSMARMAALLKTLGHPETLLPPSFHVTGTNGKGSTATMLSAIGQAAGKRVGLFTSPYIVRFNDRFQINGEDISDSDLARYTKRVSAAAAQVTADSGGELVPTEFEAVTAIMFCYFAEEELDLAVIEVGIGGRFDSTNLLQSTAVSVVTSIALDHQAMLGDSLFSIAKQKAGIIKDEKPVVLGPRISGPAKRVLEEEAALKEAPLILAGPKNGRRQDGQFYRSALHGSFQEDNLQTAVAAYLALDPNTTPEVIQTGLDRAFLPGRFEKVWAENETRPTVYLDGAHNPAGLKALQQTVDQNVKEQVILCVAGLADKELISGLKPLAKDERIELVTLSYMGLPGRPALAKEDYQKAGLINLAFDRLDQVLEYAKQQGKALVFTGSLYFIADVRRHLCQTKKKF